MGKIKLTNLPIADSSEGALLYGVKNGESVAVKADSLTDADLNKKVENLHEEITLLSSNKELFEKAETMDVNLLHTKISLNIKDADWFTVDSQGVEEKITKDLFIFEGISMIWDSNMFARKNLLLHFRIKLNKNTKITRCIVASEMSIPIATGTGLYEQEPNIYGGTGANLYYNIHNATKEPYTSMYLVKEDYSKCKMLAGFCKETEDIPQGQQVICSGGVIGSTYQDFGACNTFYVAGGMAYTPSRIYTEDGNDNLLLSETFLGIFPFKQLQAMWISSDGSDYVSLYMSFIDRTDYINDSPIVYGYIPDEYNFKLPLPTFDVIFDNNEIKN